MQIIIDIVNSRRLLIWTKMIRRPICLHFGIGLNLPNLFRKISPYKTTGHDTNVMCSGSTELLLAFLLFSLIRNDGPA